MIDIPQELREKHSPVAREILRVSADPYKQKYIDKFLKSVDMRENECWQWLRGLSDRGYARMWIPEHQVYVHRWTYILFKGAIPEGAELDHLCRTHNCVNPNHLEAVTHHENTLRGISYAAINAKKTHCAKGHIFDEENTYIYGRHRHCRICRSESLTG